MQPEFYEEWRRLEKQAKATLERRPERQGFRSECHAVVLACFEDCPAYTLMVPEGNDSRLPCGVERVWRRRTDLAKCHDPIIRLRHGPQLEPTIEEQEVPLAREPVDEILAPAADLKVPARPPLKSVGIDGVTYVPLFGELFLAARFRWWGEPPSGWEGLHGLLQKTVNLVESGLT